MLTWLKILTTLITTALSVFAVTSDFKDPKSKKLKVAGYIYISIFILLSALNFILEKRESIENEESTQKNFSQVMKHTDTLLTKTEIKLKNQFDKISELNNQIDSHLVSTSKSIQTQLNQSGKDQKTIKELSRKSNTDIRQSINSLSELDSAQKKGLEKLGEISKTSEENIKSISEVFGEVNSLTGPISPIECVFRVKYYLKKAIFRPENLRSFENLLNDPIAKRYYPKSDENDWIRWLYQKETTPFKNFDLMEPNLDNLVYPKLFLQDFFYDYMLNFSFYSDSLVKNLLVNYCNLQGYCGRRSDLIYYEIHDSALIRETTFFLSEITANHSQIKSVKELLHSSYLYVSFYQGGQNNYKLALQYGTTIIRGSKYSVGASHKYTTEFGIRSISLLPFFEIKYGDNNTLFVQIPRENTLILIPQKFGNRFSESNHSILVMRLK